MIADVAVMGLTRHREAPPVEEHQRVGRSLVPVQVVNTILGITGRPADRQVAGRTIETHIVSMSSRPVSLDLFADAERGRIRRERPAALPARLPRPQQLAELPEAELAELTCLLFNELRRRIQRDGPVGADLARAIAQFAAVYQPRQQRTPPASADSRPGQAPGH